MHLCHSTDVTVSNSVCYCVTVLQPCFLFIYFLTCFNFIAARLRDEQRGICFLLQGVISCVTVTKPQLLLFSVVETRPSVMVLVVATTVWWTWTLLDVAATSSVKLPQISDRAFIDECVTEHNKARTSVSPPASNMLYMVGDGDTRLNTAAEQGSLFEFMWM